MAIYYFVIKRGSWQQFCLFLLGLIVGVSPLVLFELRHQFYNTQTVFFFIQTLFLPHVAGGTKVAFAWHYVISLTFFVILGGLGLMANKIKRWQAILICFVLLVWGVSFVAHHSSRTSALPEGWSYAKDAQAANIIKDVVTEQKLDNFRVVNLVYDTQAKVQVYLLDLASYQLQQPLLHQNWEDYKSERNLFVIGSTKDMEQTQAYEWVTFQPHKLVKEWVVDGRGNEVWWFERK